MLHALELMNECVRPEFVKMLSWLAGAKNGFKVSLGKHSTEIAKFVPEEYGNALLKSYTTADLAAIKNALDSLTEMFPKIANDVANAVGYEYNEDEGKNVMRFIRERL
jgi:aminoglycoside 6-adenylyltransferase